MFLQTSWLSDKVSPPFLVVFLSFLCEYALIAHQCPKDCLWRFWSKEVMECMEVVGEFCSWSSTSRISAFLLYRPKYFDYSLRPTFKVWDSAIPSSLMEMFPLSNRKRIREYWSWSSALTTSTFYSWVCNNLAICGMKWASSKCGSGKSLLYYSQNQSEAPDSTARLSQLYPLDNAWCLRGSCAGSIVGTLNSTNNSHCLTQVAIANH